LKSKKLLTHRTAASDKLFQDTIKAREAQASYEASVEGMSGSIVGRIMRDKRAVEARNKQNINTNYEYKLQQTQYELEGLRVQADGRGKRGPSLLATGLEIGNAAYDNGYFDSSPAGQTDYTEY
jgi:ATP-dependent phosphoenolpyruvate carboxykinase